MNYKSRIKEKGFLVNHIAKKVGISSSLFSKYLNGKRDMPIHIEDKLKTVLS